MLDPTSGSLEGYLTLISARQRLVASNIANADTPGYKTKDIEFDAELQNSMTSMTVVPEEVTGLITKNDGNNVDLDREARLLAENALHFTVASNLIRSKLKLLKIAIEGAGSAST